MQPQKTLQPLPLDPLPHLGQLSPLLTSWSNFSICMLILIVVLTIFDEMCQINTRIGRITCCLSRLGGFAPSPSPEHAEESSSDGDDDDDASGSEYDDEMMTS